ncbi:GM11965 [Drosophila sechellia]|uniref:40S ribosomal protein S6 n=1 Tax=Drosophila sechellia TaxID=7238 RepID=B4IL48_DROSE|nr:GM11965 [Drosophila sechellia]
MKLNVSYPATGCQKLFEVVDEHKLRVFYEKRMGQVVEADILGDEWKGYQLRIAGGNDKQGFPMKQGVLTHGRVRLLLQKGHSCYRSTPHWRAQAQVCAWMHRGRQHVRAGSGRAEEGTFPVSPDTTIPRRLRPKRASKIRKLYNLSKEDDVRRFVVRRPLPAKDNKKATSKAPKIQRLITPVVLQRKHRRIALKKKRQIASKEAAADYAKLLVQRKKESKAKREEAKRRRSASIRESKSSVSSDKK